VSAATIRKHAEEYLAMRRALGFKLTTFGQRLMSFVNYLEAKSSNVLTTELALAWAADASHSTDEVTWSRRLMVVRVFARHLAALEPTTEIPPEDILPHHYRRVTPYLYTSAEVCALMDAANRLRPPLRALTYRTLIGLLAVTGLRTSEACGLDRTDVDLDEGVLTIRNTKYQKHRRVPIHGSTVTALRNYAAARDWTFRQLSTAAFLVSTRSTRLDHHNLKLAFHDLLELANIRTPAGQRRPRLHDFRHSFAVATLLDWYRDGKDVQAKLPLLSTYLGHADPKSTYWYLSGSPEVLARLSARLDAAFAQS
jgi:integrase/recombinase XerD